jgi:hypothetical protein
MHSDFFSAPHDEDEADLDDEAQASAQAEKEILKYDGRSSGVVRRVWRCASALCTAETYRRLWQLRCVCVWSVLMACVGVEIRQEIEAVEHEKKNGFSKWLFRTLFHRDILVRIKMAELSQGDFWKGRQPPMPILPPDLDDNENGHVQSHSSDAAAGSGLRDMQMWSRDENIRVFYASAQRLYERRGGCQQFDGADASRKYQPLTWDKDDADAMDFVASASNIRSIGFHIPTLSRFELKCMYE